MCKRTAVKSSAYFIFILLFYFVLVLMHYTCLCFSPITMSGTQRAEFGKLACKCVGVIFWHSVKKKKIYNKNNIYTYYSRFIIYLYTYYSFLLYSVRVMVDQFKAMQEYPGHAVPGLYPPTHSCQ